MTMEDYFSIYVHSLASYREIGMESVKGLAEKLVILSESCPEVGWFGQSLFLRENILQDSVSLPNRTSMRSCLLQFLGSYTIRPPATHSPIQEKKQGTIQVSTVTGV